MEKQRLPNSTLILVFGIVSIVTCCCYGIIGAIFAIVALVLAKSAIKKYEEDPELYSGYDNVKVGRVLAIIGLVLSLIYLILTIYFYATIGREGILEMQREWMEQYGQ